MQEILAEIEVKVQDISSKNLKLNPKYIQFERAHRNGPFKKVSSRPREVVVRLLRYKDKELILSKARSNLKNTAIYIDDDYSDLVRKRRAELLPEMRAARKRGDYAVISYNRLIIRKRQDISEGA